MTEHSQRANGGSYFSESMILSILSLVKRRRQELNQSKAINGHIPSFAKNYDVFFQEMDRIENAVKNEWDYITSTMSRIDLKDGEIDEAMKNLKDAGLTKVSVSWLQRHFKLGYNRACAIKVELYDKGKIDKEGNLL